MVTGVTWRLGLTGGIGSGKSTVAKIFAEQGITIVDADIIARQLVEPGEDAWLKIKNHFGPSVLQPDGQLNRSALRKTVFNHSAEKLWLDQLLHPAIRHRMVKECEQAKSPYAILVVPLLFENNLTHLVNRVLVVDCLPESQIQRTMLRDGCEKTLVENMMQAQISRDSRLQQADDIIDTEKSQDIMYTDILKLHQTYLKRALNKE